MSVVRIHNYSVDPADLDELLARRKVLIAAVQARHPGLLGASLTGVEDGTYIDTWHWESLEQMGAGLIDIPNIPEVPAAMSLVKNNSGRNGLIIDTL